MSKQEIKNAILSKGYMARGMKDRYQIFTSRRFHGSVIRLPIAILHPPIQVHPLQHNTKVLAPLCPTAILRGSRLDTARRAARVLDLEDGLVVVGEGLEGVALVVLSALLVDGEVDGGEDGGNDGAGVLEADGELVLGGLGGEELYEGGGVGFG